MNDNADTVEFPLSQEDRERLNELQWEYEIRRRSSEVREVPASDFNRIQKEHNEAVIRKRLLERL